MAAQDLHFQRLKQFAGLKTKSLVPYNGIPYSLSTLRALISTTATTYPHSIHLFHDLYSHYAFRNWRIPHTPTPDWLHSLVSSYFTHVRPPDYYCVHCFNSKNSHRIHHQNQRGWVLRFWQNLSSKENTVTGFLPHLLQHPFGSSLISSSTSVPATLCTVR